MWQRGSVANVGEWETGLNVAHDRGIIDAELRDRLAALSFERETQAARFPMRIALIVLGAILLVSAGFAVIVRVLGDDPSQVLIAAVLLLVAVIAEGVAWLIRRAKALAFLAGIVGSFAGIPLGFAVAVLLPNDPDAIAGAVGSFVAATWSVLWFQRTRAGLAIAAVVAELAFFIGFAGDWANFSMETTGVVLCILGVIAAMVSIFGRLKPSLPPLVASLIVIGYGCIAQNTYGGDVIAVIGVVISAGLFLLSYRRGEALMSAATAISTGVWAVVLTSALTEGAIAPLIVAAVIGAGLIFWGLRLSRR
ncbi:MAG: hypothetical protein EBS71_05925 [Actinobacteria bacterium]|jgi:hypothetical protein|nr:hypothetical protein [Actinomycetota bacterium]NCZ67713.1 hypothetical protein [Acidimicrobiia bacterium]